MQAFLEKCSKIVFGLKLIPNRKPGRFYVVNILYTAVKNLYTLHFTLKS